MRIRLPFSKRVWLVWSSLPWLALALASCTSDHDSNAVESSGSTNWSHCQADGDCADYANASCAADGYCVDASGRHILTTDEGNAAGADGATQAPSDSDSTPSAETPEPPAGPLTPGPISNVPPMGPEASVSDAGDAPQSGNPQPTPSDADTPRPESSSPDAGQSPSPSSNPNPAGGCHDASECGAGQSCHAPYDYECTDDSCALTGCATTADFRACSQDSDCEAAEVCDALCGVCTAPCKSDADCRMLAPATDLSCDETGHCSARACDAQTPCAADFSCIPMSTTSLNPMTVYSCQPQSCETDADCDPASVCVQRASSQRVCMPALGQCESAPSEPDASTPRDSDASSAASGPVCGAAACDEGERCCDPCSGGCVPEASGAQCARSDWPLAYCDPTTRPFSCGNIECSFVADAYCEVADADTSQPVYTCRDLPSECVGMPACDCVLTDLASNGSCSTGPDEQLIIALPSAP
ncbi:MAG TPA: hypothetical protein VHM70_16300 [Polyangiaceae bacterium]|nr:hypothetical protein [Polyangiaceae bacterium]